MSFLEAAKRVLAAANEPLHYREITQRVLAEGRLETRGKTPWASMNAQITSSLNRHGDQSPFIRTKPGVFGLRRWLEEGQLEAGPIAASVHAHAFVPHYPLYDHTRAVLPAWAGARRSDVTGMRAAIFALSGTPQSNVDWSDPDRWIGERLDGGTAELARRTWEGSGKQVNPRHVTGNWLLATNYDLLADGADGRLEISTHGREFIASPDGPVVQEIDREEGLGKILALVADLGTPARADLLETWQGYLATESRIRSESAASAALWARLRNLIQRGLVERFGRAHAITPAGLRYLEILGVEGPDEPPPHDQEIRRLLQEQKLQVRDSIHGLLLDMDPYAFEHLIKRLLEEMGYEDVEVTAPTNDKGVDVVAKIQLGITDIREVVQVKRVRGNISRPVLDQLRGTLHRFDAVRGTIITTGGFSKGTSDVAIERGASPITLIDGHKLIDLLVEHGIGVKKQKLESWELDSSAFTGEAEDDEIGGEGG